MVHSRPAEINLCNRFLLPEDISAVLWDMDGVLIDSLSFAIQASRRLIMERYGSQVSVDAAFLKSVFPLDPPAYWRAILPHLQDQCGASLPSTDAEAMCEDYLAARLTATFPILPGIPELLADLARRAIPCAVVSNNPLSQTIAILNNCGLRDSFSVIVGNDDPALRKKPAPDTYLFAAKQLGLDPTRCVVVEDSILGVAAGIAAGCRTVGVATGSADTGALEAAGSARVYSSFRENVADLRFGDVRVKQIVTLNEFLSHMVEHIAWRLGTSIDFAWNNNDSRAAGAFLGRALRRFPLKTPSAACLGMIDDGSAEVLVDTGRAPGVFNLNAQGEVALDWFLSLRCEQLPNGAPLQEFLAGLAEGLQAAIDVTICSAEDPHHTWEGVFRAVGISLSRIFGPVRPLHAAPTTDGQENTRVLGDLAVHSVGIDLCEVTRRTAESEVSLVIDFARRQPSAIHLQVGPSICTEGFSELLLALADNAGFTLQLSFTASVITSSHVLFEDVALVLGRALLELLVIRMMSQGTDGAGSNIHTAADLQDLAVGVALSVEGRKFWSFVPFGESYSQLRRRILVGQDVFGTLRSEDLDDFVDGLAGGLAASIMIHVRRPVSPDETWLGVFTGLGKAIAEAFLPNPFRRGVPPGVKATLS